MIMNCKGGCCSLLLRSADSAVWQFLREGISCKVPSSTVWYSILCGKRYETEYRRYLLDNTVLQRSNKGHELKPSHDNS